MSYATYGGRDEGFGITHCFTFFVMIYILGISFQMFLLCKLSFLKPFFLNLLTEQYIFKYLGPNSGMVALVKTTGPVLGVRAVEGVTAEVALNRLLASISDDFDRLWGSNADNWFPEVKRDYLERRDRARNNSRGLVTTMVDADRRSALAESISKSFSKVLGSIAKIFKSNSSSFSIVQ